MPITQALTSLEIAYNPTFRQNLYWESLSLLYKMLRAVENTDSVCVIRPCSRLFYLYSKLYYKLVICCIMARCSLQWMTQLYLYLSCLNDIWNWIIWQLLPTTNQKKQQQYFILQINKTIKLNPFLCYHLWHCRLCTKLNSLFVLVSEMTWHKSNLSGNLRQAWQSCTWSIVLDSYFRPFFVFFYIMPIISQET